VSSVFKDSTDLLNATDPCSCYCELHTPYSEAIGERAIAKGNRKYSVASGPGTANQRNRRVNGDLGCFEVRGYAVDWLLRSDLGEMIKTIVADQAVFPDYQVPKETTAPKKPQRKNPKR
jgi:hypothetical protein